MCTKPAACVQHAVLFSQSILQTPMRVNVPSMQLDAVIAVIYVATGSAIALVSMLCCRVCRESLSLLRPVVSLQEEVLYKRVN